jgi:hypothetical protein
MRSLLVYSYRGKYYMVLLGGSRGFQTPEEVFTSGEEKQEILVTEPTSTPLLEMLRKVIAEADRLNIKDILCVEDVIARRTVAVVAKPSGPVH